MTSEHLTISLSPREATLEGTFAFSQFAHMTKEEFLKDASAFVLRMEEPPPADWIAAAWSEPQFRINVTYALVRSVSKNGDFFIASYWLEVLPTFLSARDVVGLYERIRDKSGRSELE
jgi:hypothetical protein